MIEVNANRVRLFGISLRHEKPLNIPWLFLRFNQFLNHLSKDHALNAELESYTTTSMSMAKNLFH